MVVVVTEYLEIELDKERRRVDFGHRAADLRRRGNHGRTDACPCRRPGSDMAARCRKTRLQVFSVTDANDRELVDQSSLAVLLPVTSEVVGSTLTLALLDWVAYEISGQ